MYVIDFFVSLAICLAAFLVASVAAFQWQRTSAVRQRVLRMMLTFGIDAETARSPAQAQAEQDADGGDGEHGGEHGFRPSPAR